MTTSVLDHTKNRQILAWLLWMCLAIYLMVIIGGATRLTESGLSMVDWKPVTGVFPPMSQEKWEESFSAYRESPQFNIRFPDMTLSEYKTIFWWEYIHRLWGRLLGVFFAVPFFYFWIRGFFSSKLLKQLWIAFLLGGTQGLLGWYMVQSGLVDIPWVSAYRLSVHLLLALFLFSFLEWLALNLWRDNEQARSEYEAMRQSSLFGKLKLFSIVLMGILIVQLFYGGLMSGLRAAMSYPTFPLMNGAWVPEFIWTLEPGWRNLFENNGLVQLIHRVIGTALAMGCFIFWWISKPVLQGGFAKGIRHALLGVVLLQFILGVITVINSKGSIPVGLGVLHQAGAVLLLAVMTGLNHLLLKNSKS